VNREQFLKNLRASKVQIHPLQLEGWSGLVYLRPQTLGEIRDSLMRADTDDLEGDARSKIKTDSLFLARSIARLVRDEAGELLFDADNDAEMGELMAGLADTAPGISRQLNDAWNALNEPTKAEVTPEGN